MSCNPAVQNWVTSAELAAMLAHGWQEVDRHVADDDGRTVVRLHSTRERCDTFRSLADVERAHEQLALI